MKIIGDSRGPVRIGSRVQILEKTVLHLLPDNELIIGDDDDRSILDGFPARLAGTLAGPPPIPGWALPPDAVATLHKVQR